MFNLFKQKCPVCGMVLEKGKEYPAKFGKKFCSENCQEEYRKQLTKGHSQHSRGGCCH